jgi:hypothetical protein
VNGTYITSWLLPKTWSAPIHTPRQRAALLTIIASC